MLKKYFCITLIISLLAITISRADAQKNKGYVFENIVEVPHTAVKDQGWTGTCWDFATISLLESEVLRKTGIDDIDLAEMYPVRFTYVDKAQNYVRLHGNTTFGQGGQAHDVLVQMKDYGLVPEHVFQTYKIDEEFNHRELADILHSFLDGLLEGSTITERRWMKAYNAILDVYLGKEIESFRYQGKQYTPVKFMNNYLKLDPANYIEIISNSNKPYYEQVRLEVPDNWNYNDEYYNVPLEDMKEIVDFALENGYSICWDADVSDEYFNYKDTCVAFVPQKEPEKGENIPLPAVEKDITTEMRQKAFDTFETTDDHLMHLVGMAQDQNGNQFYKIKNSWGTDNKYNGYDYISLPYFKLRTINIMLNKEALPGDIKKKLELKKGLF